MAECVLLIFIGFICFWIPYKYYEPRIEVIVLVKHYRVYLWYNSYEGTRYKRVYKFLFEV